MIKKAKTKEEKQKILDQWRVARSQGVSRIKFCESVGVLPNTFFYWLSQAKWPKDKKQTGSLQKFVPAGMDGSSGEIRVQKGNITIYCKDQESLKTVLKILGEA